MAESKGLAERKRDMLRARVVEEAGALFRADGFEATTLQAIADASVTSVNTILRHFPSKQRLYAEAAKAGGWSAQDVLAGLLGAEAAADLCSTFEARPSGKRAATR